MIIYTFMKNMRLVNDQTCQPVLCRNLLRYNAKLQRPCNILIVSSGSVMQLAEIHLSLSQLTCVQLLSFKKENHIKHCF